MAISISCQQCPSPYCIVQLSHNKFQSVKLSLDCDQSIPYRQ